MPVTVSHVGVTFKNTTVLTDVTTEFPDKVITALLGPSGSGKTTLIRCLVGAIRPTTGEVMINELPVPHRSLLEKVGYMPQSDAVYTDLSARANLEFFAGLHRISGARRHDRIANVLEIVGLGEHADERVGNFSGGMRRRLSLAITLLPEPSTLILDEPTVGMDPVLRRSVWGSLRRLATDGQTVLISTHVMEEARRCDRAVLLRDGEKVADGTVSALEASSDGEGLEHYFFRKVH